MQLQVNETTTALDLAEALKGDQGTFIAQQNGQNYRVIARPGSSIASLKPFGPRLVTFASLIGQGSSAESWSITKISNGYELGDQIQQERSQSGRVGD